MLISGLVARLHPGVPAYDALRLMVNTYEGRKPMASWRRPPGRPHHVWLKNVQEDANALLLSTSDVQNSIFKIVFYFENTK